MGSYCCINNNNNNDNNNNDIKNKNNNYNNRLLTIDLSKIENIFKQKMQNSTNEMYNNSINNNLNNDDENNNNNNIIQNENKNIKENNNNLDDKDNIETDDNNNNYYNNLITQNNNINYNNNNNNNNSINNNNNINNNNSINNFNNINNNNNYNNNNNDNDNDNNYNNNNYNTIKNKLTNNYKNLKRKSFVISFDKIKKNLTLNRKIFHNSETFIQQHSYNISSKKIPLNNHLPSILQKKSDVSKRVNFKNKSRFYSNNNINIYTNESLDQSFDSGTIKIKNSIKKNKFFNNIINNSIKKNFSLQKKITVINKPFSNDQIDQIKNILTENEIINNEMEEHITNTIINLIIYEKIEENEIFFTEENKNDDFYYIIEKGKIEFCIDDDLYELNELNGISTQTLLNHSKHKCYIKSEEKTFLYVLPLIKYKKICIDYENKLNEEKFEYLNSHFFFQSFQKDDLMNIAKNSQKIKISKIQNLIKEDEFPNCIYYIIEGKIICYKNNIVIKTYKQNEIIGEIFFFTQMESFYNYNANPNTTLIKINNIDIMSIYNESMIESISHNIFIKNFKEKKNIFSHYINENNIEKIFRLFQLKFYFCDKILTKNEKKIFIPISGTLIKNNNEDSKNILDLISANYKTKNIKNGEIFIDSILEINNENNKNKLNDYNNIICDESVILESNFYDLINIFSQSNKIFNFNFPILNIINILKENILFKYLNLFKTFEIINQMKIKSFKYGKTIIKNGPNSKKFFLILEGRVNIQIKKSDKTIVIRTLENNQTFGDISNKNNFYTQKVDFIANSYVKCLFLEKEIYEKFTENSTEILNFNQLIINDFNDLTITLDELYYLKDLGQGAYGKVYLIHDKKKFYAMKTAEINEMVKNKKTAKYYLNEKRIMNSIDHNFIVKFYNTFKSNDYLFFLLEYIDGVNLREYLNNKKKENLRNLYEVSFFGAILFCVLNYLQTKRILHRDLKPENLMIGKNGYLKVIDFGIAKDLNANNDKNKHFSIVGTTHYIAPEVIEGKHYSFGIDYWAVGVVLYEIFYGFVPFGFNSKDQMKIYKEIKEKKIHFPVNEFDAEKFENFNNLIKMLLNKNPKQRLNNFKNVKNHCFFKDFNFDDVLNFKMKSVFIPAAKTNLKDLKEISVSFKNFLANNIFFSSTFLSQQNNNNNNNLYDDILNVF